ncbi:MAG TPA: hypothetical protein VF364_05160 [Candidatus Limnocylindria bacterium]
MSLFNRAIRPPPSLSDAAVERYLAALRDEIDPDPLFRRRLRTDAVNRFVAAREGIGQPARRWGVGGKMGRLGRACLYASFTLGMTGTAVLAAAENALPGEALYPLKQRIEELRYELVPAHLHGDLAGYALGMRIEELARLTDAGRIDLALALAPAIEAEYARLESLGATVGPFRAARIERHLLVLEMLLQQLPDAARERVERAFDNAPAPGADTRGSANGRGATPADGPGPMSGPREEPAGAPDRTPRPEATPRPDRTPRPEHSKEPAPSLEVQSEG